ncbi:MAG: type III secretion system export apparatus subunit SctS [Rhizobacter sp.]|nr:type III secretion system export apparatus subunit SctS [Rhizobacter sp.]
MTPTELLSITREGLLVVLWVSLPVVLVSTLSAVIVAVLQAVTQIQDQSIGQSIRLIAVLFTIVVAAGWLGRDVMRFAERAFQTLAQLP